MLWFKGNEYFELGTRIYSVYKEEICYMCSWNDCFLFHSRSWLYILYCLLLHEYAEYKKCINCKYNLCEWESHEQLWRYVCFYSDRFVNKLKHFKLLFGIFFSITIRTVCCLFMGISMWSCIICIPVGCEIEIVDWEGL